MQERILSLRDWDAICEDGKERILESEVIEEGVILKKAELLPQSSTE